MTIHNSYSFKIGKIRIYENLYGHINLIHFPQTDSKDKGLESLAMSEKGLKKHDVVILGDGIAKRNGEHLDENEKGSHEHTHCSPALGGGVCPPMYPVLGLALRDLRQLLMK